MMYRFSWQEIGPRVGLALTLLANLHRKTGAQSPNYGSKIAVHMSHKIAYCFAECVIRNEVLLHRLLLVIATSKCATEFDVPLYRANEAKDTHGTPIPVAKVTK